MAKESTVWEVWTYDVWGNAKDGYDVNDRFCVAREHAIAAPVETHNPGTPHAFQSASPTDGQIRDALGCGRVKIDTDGDDLVIYVNRTA